MDNPSKRPVPHKKGIGLRFALAGILHVFSAERNAKIHLFIAGMVIAAGWFLELTTTEWLVVVLCIGFVITTEMLNSAAEMITDIVSPGYSKEAGRIKDIAAGGVLVAAVASVVAGLIIFIPKLAVIAGTLTGSG